MVYSSSLSFLLSENIKNVVQKVENLIVAVTLWKLWEFFGFGISEFGRNMDGDMNFFGLCMRAFWLFHVNRAFLFKLKKLSNFV